jgi:hypothetical protein
VRIFSTRLNPAAAACDRHTKGSDGAIRSTADLPLRSGMRDSDSGLGIGISDPGSGIRDAGFCGTGTGSCERLVAAVLRECRPRLNPGRGAGLAPSDELDATEAVQPAPIRFDSRPSGDHVDELRPRVGGDRLRVISDHVNDRSKSTSRRLLHARPHAPSGSRRHWICRRRTSDRLGLNRHAGRFGEEGRSPEEDRSSAGPELTADGGACNSMTMNNIPL